MYYLEPDARKICLIKISIDILIFVAEKYNRQLQNFTHKNILH